MSTPVSLAKSALNGLVGGRVFRDRHPDQVAAWPYLVVTDDVATVPALAGDGRISAWARVFQVDLYQRADGESDALVVDVRDAIDGMLRAQGWTSARVNGVIRFAGVEDGVVRHAITCRIGELT